MAVRFVLAAGVIAIALSGCSLNDRMKPNQTEATAAAGAVASQASKTAAGSSISRKEVAKKAAATTETTVVGRKGQYLLCRLVDEHNGRTTTYYICREQTCAGQESLVQTPSTRMTRSGCIKVCRKAEDINRARISGNSYCVN